MRSPIHLIAHHSARRFLNFRLGWTLMRDPKVAVGKKVLALGAGIAITVALIASEVPLEGALALVAPLLGLGADIVIDGAEVILFPMLLALAVLPYLVKPEPEYISVEPRS